MFSDRPQNIKFYMKLSLLLFAMIAAERPAHGVLPTGVGPVPFRAGKGGGKSLVALPAFGKVLNRGIEPRLHSSKIGSAERGGFA